MTSVRSWPKAITHDRPVRSNFIHRAVRRRTIRRPQFSMSHGTHWPGGCRAHSETNCLSYSLKRLPTPGKQRHFSAEGFGIATSHLIRRVGEHNCFVYLRDLTDK